jgi:SAM-dependent methyltransferase
MITQDSIFSQFEGDRWFDRNRGALGNFDSSTDLPLRLIDLYRLAPARVLEIGAANGFRVATVHERTGAEAVAVEPSARAVLDGQENFPGVSFVRGTARAVPLRTTFDLVIVNFVFHWIDRRNLLEVAAETDRLVAEGGFLIIGDFYPTNQLQVRYHHLQDREVYTYKQNYAGTFLASGTYHPVALLTAHHADKRLSAEVAESDRIGAWLLRKELTSHYLVSGVNGTHGTHG